MHVSRVCACVCVNKRLQFVANLRTYIPFICGALLAIIRNITGIMNTDGCIVLALLQLFFSCSEIKLPSFIYKMHLSEVKWEQAGSVVVLWRAAKVATSLIINTFCFVADAKRCHFYLCLIWQHWQRFSFFLLFRSVYTLVSSFVVPFQRKIHHLSQYRAYIFCYCYF